MVVVDRRTMTHDGVLTILYNSRDGKVSYLYFIAFTSVSLSIKHLSYLSSALLSWFRNKFHDWVQMDRGDVSPQQLRKMKV